MCLPLQVPTVNVHDRESADRMIAKFADLMDLSESRKHIVRFFKPQSASVGSGLTPAKRSSSSCDLRGSASSELAAEVRRSSGNALPQPTPVLGCDALDSTRKQQSGCRSMPSACATPKPGQRLHGTEASGQPEHRVQHLSDVASKRPETYVSPLHRSMPAQQPEKLSKEQQHAVATCLADTYEVRQGIECALMHIGADDVCDAFDVDEGGCRCSA